MTFYKIIAGNGRTYTTSQDIECDLWRPGTEWINIRTVEGNTVFINLRNIAAIEASEVYVREPSETEQVIDATLNRMFGFGKPKQIDTIDLGEKVE